MWPCWCIIKCSENLMEKFDHDIGMGMKLKYIAASYTWHLANFYKVLTQACDSY